MSIRELIGLQKGAPEQVEYDHGRRPSTKKYYPEPHHPSVSLMMCKRILGRIRETKVTDTELSWLYSTLIARQPIDPTHL
jgi:hypothetical protein